MTMRDETTTKQVKRAISPVSVADNTAQVSQIIDRQGFNALTFLILIGAVADVDATFAVLIQHGDAANLSDANDVPDADLISQAPGTAPETAAAFRYDNDDQVRKIGYRGTKRYVRLTITPTNNTGAALLAAVAILEQGGGPVVQAAA